MQRLYYQQHPNGGLVFAEADQAEHVSRIHRALSLSSSWGQFRRDMPSDALAELMPRILENLEWEDDEDHEEAPPLPEDEAPFDSSMIPGYDEGDYPEWLQASMHEVLPPELLQKFAEERSSVLNGLYWHIVPNNEEALVSDLRAQGFEVTRRDDLTFY